MKRIALLDGREGYKLDEPKAWAMARRMVSLASVLGEEDHVAALQRFFAESIRKLGEELAAFKYDHQELPWEGY
ncbi:MAG TPA: hypothetical protein VJ827_10845 [Rubrobacter sp.]|nr:hypothetical protein [Rubrobacter sp.]